MPPVLTQYFMTGGDIRAIWGVISIFIAGAIYYPFFKVMENQHLSGEEAKMEGEIE